MAVEYLGLSSLNGPLAVLEDVSGASYDEIVEMTVDGKEKKLGRIIEAYEDKAVIQVFESTGNMALKNTHTRLTGHPMEIGVSADMLGRTFDGLGNPIDGLGPILADKKLDVNGKPLNPVAREYPRNYIRTGISAIDGLMTLIRGQKLPIFSGNGLPHDQLAAQIVMQSSLGDNSDEKFAVVFAAMGVKYDVAEYFERTFRESGVLDHVAMFINLANDPVVERLITPKVALTVAEYLAFEKGMHILVILTVRRCVRSPPQRARSRPVRDIRDTYTVIWHLSMSAPESSPESTDLSHRSRSLPCRTMISPTRSRTLPVTSQKVRSFWTAA